MKIRSSLVAPLVMIALVFLPGVPLAILVKPEVIRSSEQLAQFLLAFTTLATVMYLFGIRSPIAEVYQDRFRTKSRVWSSWRALGPGERFVICRNRLHVQLVDGTLQATTIARWKTARRHWRRIEQGFPCVDEL